MAGAIMPNQRIDFGTLDSTRSVHSARSVVATPPTKETASIAPCGLGGRGYCQSRRVLRNRDRGRLVYFDAERVFGSDFHCRRVPGGKEDIPGLRREFPTGDLVDHRCRGVNQYGVWGEIVLQSVRDRRIVCAREKDMGTIS